MMKSLSLCQKLGTFFLALAMCVFVIGCGSKVTSENFMKVKDGMSESDVNGLLGSPTKTEEKDMAPFGKVKVAEWKSGNNEVTIMYKDGKVVGQKGKFGS
jgi:hypothetical protein